MKTTRILLLLALVTALPAAYAQNGKWPDKSVRAIVPFAPGGASDVVARIMSPKFAEEFNRFVAQEIAKYTKVVKDGNIRVE